MSLCVLRPRVIYLVILSCDENRASYPILKKQQQPQEQLGPAVIPTPAVIFITLHHLCALECN